MGCMVYVLVLFDKGDGGDGRSCSDLHEKQLSVMMT